MHRFSFATINQQSKIEAPSLSHPKERTGSLQCLKWVTWLSHALFGMFLICKVVLSTVNPATKLEDSIASPVLKIWRIQNLKIKVIRGGWGHLWSSAMSLFDTTHRLPVPVLYHFQDIASYLSNAANYSYPLCVWRLHLSDVIGISTRSLASVK